MDQLDINRLADFSERVRESTIKRLRLIPRGKENMGVPNGAMSPADIAAHLIQIDKVLLDLPATRSKGLDLGVTGQKIVASRGEYDDLVSELEDLRGERSDFIRKLTDTDLGLPIQSETTAGKGELDLGAMIYRLLDHEIHHRGALAVYLRVYREGCKVHLPRKSGHRREHDKIEKRRSKNGSQEIRSGVQRGGSTALADQWKTVERDC